jgi:DNA polymerase-3 subunit epsilon
MLMEEFARVGKRLDMAGRRTIDVQRIFYKMEPRTLAAAYRYYCNKSIDNAHDAMADVRATVEVLNGQLQMYAGQDLVPEEGEVVKNPVRPDVEALHEFTNDLKIIDATQRLKYNHEGVVVFNFGKYAGKPVGETLFRDRQYYDWMKAKEFSTQVKEIITDLYESYRKENGHAQNK